MENIYQGKYFTFFNTQFNQVKIIQFKAPEEDFFSANAIWEPVIISNLIYKIQYDDIIIENIKLKDVFNYFKILFIKENYFSGQLINFIVLNDDYADVNFSYILLDSNDWVQAFNEFNFTKIIPYQEFQIPINHPGNFKLAIYYNHQFQYNFPIQVFSYSLSEEFCNFEQLPNKLTLKFLKEVDQSQALINYFNLNNFRMNYDTLATEIEEELEELYVPLNKIFSKINDNEIMRYFKIKLEGKYNPQGILTIINLLKAMSDKEEITFIENLMLTEKDLALALLENIFDFDLLFMMPGPEAREILTIIGNYELAIAFKGETKNRLDLIKNLISEKCWENILEFFKDNESIQMDKVNEVQKRIGTFIRSYYQEKFGIPFVFEKKKITKLKIKEIHCDIKDKKIDVPISKMFFNGNYLMQCFLGSKTKHFLFKSSNQEFEYSFLLKLIYCNKVFFEITNIDHNYIYLKFKNDILKAQILFGNNENIFTINDFSKVYEDEIIKIPYQKQQQLHLIIGVINKGKTNKIDEAEIIIEIFDNISNQFFIDENVLSKEDILIKNLAEKKKQLFFIEKQELPLSINFNEIQEKITINNNLQLECEIPNTLVSSLDVLEINEVIQLQNPILNNTFLLTLIDNDVFSHDKQIINSYLPVIVKYFNESIHIYNLLDATINVKIFIDNQLKCEEKITEKYWLMEKTEFLQNIKIIINSKIGEIIYKYFKNKEKQIVNLKDKYILADESYEKILVNILNKEQRNIIDLIMELKLYIFLFNNNHSPLYKNLQKMILNMIKTKYFRSKYFLYTPESNFNILDINESLLHFHEIYKRGLNELDSMIDKNLHYLKKFKLKDKRLVIYEEKFRIRDIFKKILKK